MTAHFVAAITALGLAGCAGSSPVLVRTPVPIVCQEGVPDRPAMPTEALEVGVPPFVLTRAALAEIEEREAYEVKLRAALEACVAPL